MIYSNLEGNPLSKLIIPGLKGINDIMMYTKDHQPGLSTMCEYLMAQVLY